MQLYNTLTRTKETFEPIDGKTARIYSCGPTVYNTAHIGNLRAYIAVDVLKKATEYANFKVFDVMNTTDVGHLVSDADDGDDKVDVAARKNNTTPQAIAKQFTEKFFSDCEKLNIRKPTVIAPATSYIKEMIDFIKSLEAKGLTYVTSDGVYFDSSKFGNYNKLSRASIENNIAGARVDIGEKKNPHDFAVWKFVGENSLQKWQSPWGKWGCPGWHIECSAIAKKLLGETFDIHTGGVDHIPVHHTNEIAQSESLTGKPMANFWVHNEFITVDGGKMSKSLGNFYTLDDIIARGFSPIAFRYYCLLTHYRSILNFTWDGLQAAQSAYNNLIPRLARHAQSKESPPARFISTILDDLNTPKTIAGIRDLLKEAPSRGIYRYIIELDKVLSLDLEHAVEKYIEAQQTKPEIPDEVLALIEKRLTAKLKKDFKTADELRDKILAHGFEVTDTKDGFKISPAKPK